MFDSKRAAEFFVVAWCRDWTLGRYLMVITESHVIDGELGDKVEKARALYPWLPRTWKHYSKPIRAFTGGAYPKLSAWLFSRQDDIARLKCAPQIEKLRPPERQARAVSSEDRAEMIGAQKDQMAASASWRLSRDSFKTHMRSAWNVCK